MIKLLDLLNESPQSEYPPYMYSPIGFSCAVCKYYYVEWESLVDEFDEYGDNEEYKYEPTDEFILFLESKGYDGFINGDNILIFNKNKLFK